MPVKLGFFICLLGISRIDRTSQSQANRRDRNGLRTEALTRGRGQGGDRHRVVGR